jgi:hypothetical protein
MHQFQDKRTVTAKRLPLGNSYVTDFSTYDAQLMQDFHADYVHPDHAGAVAAPSALVEIAFDLALEATGHRKYDTAAAARGGSISKSPAACDNMPPGFTQSVRSIRKESRSRGVNNTKYYYTASCGKKFTSLNAAWDHHDPTGEARRVFDEAKEATKEAAKRVSEEAAREAARPAREAAWEAARPAKEAAKRAAMSSTSIANGDVICCGRATCQGTQKYTGASWTHQFGKTKTILCNTCGKRPVASKWVVVAA